MYKYINNFDKSQKNKFRFHDSAYTLFEYCDEIAKDGINHSIFYKLTKLLFVCKYDCWSNKYKKLIYKISRLINQ